MILGEKSAKNFKRIKLFLFGALLGSGIMYFMVFKNKTYFKTPQQIIKQQLQSRKLVFTQRGLCSINCSGITESEIKQLFANGSVNYDKSEVHAIPCKKYALEGKTTHHQKIRLFCELCDTETKIVASIDLNLKNDTCSCQ